MTDAARCTKRHEKNTVPSENLILKDDGADRCYEIGQNVMRSGKHWYRINHFTCSGACADACWPSGWLAPAWRVESAAESIILHILGLALMIAGLAIGWPLTGGWNLLQNRSFYMFWGLR